ncbi:hypothetical protein O3M35_012286 [Rhynocoris fuscipes]|uniref:Bromo domain-containing protein n=1 Tax=Rhynocoris fuscipes TaxID=488301 RepID=A0AAW1CXL5_9HEMI
MEPKRKRGRPPKVHNNPLLQPLEFPVSHLNETSARDLQFGYKILKEILNISKSKLILEKPDENLFGLHDYYEIIKKPMWLAEVSRKYENKEYKDLKEVIADFRLTLENCYRFWGANHKFSKHIFRIEKILEKHLKELPGNLKLSCNLIVDGQNSETSSNDSALLDEYQSKILQNLEKKVNAENDQFQEITLEELNKWESEILMNKTTKKQINFIGELADIGFFIKLTHQVLCVKPVTQYEIERMLLIPRESTTLATLMTAFLCPTAMRGSLYLKPLMSYEVWTAILAKKLDSWYNAYVKFQNKVQIFLKYGIEPHFWEVVGEDNPLAKAEFHTLPLVKKAWILKTLCTTVFHSNKKLEEYFNTVEDCKLRGNVIYEDSKFLYINEFTPEIRIYRIAKCDTDCCNQNKEQIQDCVNCSINKFQEDGEPVVPPISRKQRFCLIANDRETLETLMTTFSRKKKSVQAVEKLLSIEKNNKLSLSGLKSMYFQWKKYIDRSPIVVETSRNYWINKITSPNHTKISDEGENAYNKSGLIVFGKRPSKRKFSFQDTHSSSSNDEKLSEGSISDWEDGNIRRSKRIRRSKTFHRQWERRYEESIYETYNNNRTTSTTPESRSSAYGYPSRISCTDLTNPNDYVSFLHYQQQKINSLYNMKRNGLTIRKMFTNPSKRSIVSAAVENAAVLHDVKLDVEKTVESKVLMISMGGNGSGEGTSTEVPFKLEPEINVPTSSTFQAETMCSLVSSSVNDMAFIKQDTNSVQDTFPEIHSSHIDDTSNNDTPTSMVDSFLSDWMLSKNLPAPVSTDNITYASVSTASDCPESSGDLMIL